MKRLLSHILLLGAVLVSSCMSIDSLSFAMNQHPSQFHENVITSKIQSCEHCQGMINIDFGETDISTAATSKNNTLKGFEKSHFTPISQASRANVARISTIFSKPENKIFDSPHSRGVVLII